MSYAPISSQLQVHLTNNMAEFVALLRKIETTIVRKNAPLGRIALEIFGHRSWEFPLFALNCDLGDLTVVPYIRIPVTPSAMVAAVKIIAGLPALSGEAEGVYRDLDAEASISLVTFNS